MKYCTISVTRTQTTVKYRVCIDVFKSSKIFQRVWQSFPSPAHMHRRLLQQTILVELICFLKKKKKKESAKQ